MPFVSITVLVVAFVGSGEVLTAFAPPRWNFPPTPAHPSNGNKSRARIKPCASLADDAANSDGTPPPPKVLSASQRERRDEDRRREDRVEEKFARPGVSSALPGARDFAIDVAKTEQQYLQSLSGGGKNADYYAAIWTEEGLAHLRMLRFEEAAASFAQVYDVKPEAYLWQDGLLKYYLEDYHGAAESLAKNAFRYESRFLEAASEERIWRDAAELKIVHSLNGGRRVKNKDFPVAMRVPEEEGMDQEQGEKDNIASERRKVLRLARHLFSSSLRNNSAGVAMARAQLQAVCGDSFPPSLVSALPTMPKEAEQPTPSPSNAPPDRKMYRLHSLFYLGLHYDALGQSYESKQCMKMALKTCATSISGNNQDITYLLPVIHMTSRDWYDDDDFEAAEAEEEEAGVAGSDNATKSEMTIRESIKDMRVVDLKGELKRRKLRVSGSKKELQDRLVTDLKN